MTSSCGDHAVDGNMVDRNLGKAASAGPQTKVFFFSGFRVSSMSLHGALKSEENCSRMGLGGRYDGVVGERVRDRNGLRGVTEID